MRHALSAIYAAAAILGLTATQVPVNAQQKAAHEIRRAAHGRRQA